MLRQCPPAVTAQVGEQQRIAVDLVDHAVLVGDPARPETGQRVPQRLGFADARERFPPGLVDRLVDALDDSSVVLFPVQAIVPCFGGKDELHSTEFRSTPLPAFN